MKKVTLVVAALALTAGGSVALADDSGHLSVNTLKSEQWGHRHHMSGSSAAIRDAEGRRAWDHDAGRYAYDRAAPDPPSGPYPYDDRGYVYGSPYGYGAPYYYPGPYAYGYSPAPYPYGWNYGYGPIAPVGPLGVIAPIVDAPFAATGAIVGGG
jgi:hypothetical protein